MKQITIFIMSLIMLGITGCGWKESFQPPPPPGANWKKPGADRVEIDKKLMECGLPSPTIPGGWDAHRLSMNELATIDFCMERAGFRYKERSGAQAWCRNHKDKNLPVCRPGAVIPAPSVKKRLNSSYCKGQSGFAVDKNEPECQP